MLDALVAKHLSPQLGFAVRPGVPSFTARCPCLRRSSPRSPSRRHVVRAQKDDNNNVVKTAIKVGGDLLETASGWVPESVPRPAAKGLVAVGGGVVAFWLVQKVLSTVVTIGLLVGGAYLWINSSSSQGGGSGEGDEGDDGEDPVARARKIMDKYK